MIFYAHLFMTFSLLLVTWSHYCLVTTMNQRQNILWEIEISSDDSALRQFLMVSWQAHYNKVLTLRNPYAVYPWVVQKLLANAINSKRFENPFMWKAR